MISHKVLEQDRFKRLKSNIQPLYLNLSHLSVSERARPPVLENFISSQFSTESSVMRGKKIKIRNCVYYSA